MNKQRKVLITTTYNEMGVIIDTKAEEVAEPEKRKETHASDSISRQAALDIVAPYDDNRAMRDALEELPSAQPEQDREFIKLVRNSNGRPYYSIIYLEFDDNGVGHDFEGYSSYSLDVISDYLKKYFMPPAKPEHIKGHWIIRETSFGDTEARCSHCGFTTLVDEPGNGLHMVSDLNFCPNCGAKMDDEVTE